MPLRDLPLVDAGVPADASLVEAAEALSATRSPALALLDKRGRVLEISSEGDRLRAVLPGGLAELRDTAFLREDAEGLRRREAASGTRRRSAHEAPLGHRQTRPAAERFPHTEEDALPGADGDRFRWMLSRVALCRAWLERV